VVESTRKEVGPSCLAFISDIHSNLEALEAVLRQLSRFKIYCLGDAVGYGASPNSVIELLISNSVTCVLGNHDETVLGGDFSEFNSKAAIALKWTADQLTEESRAFLNSLPRESRFTFAGKAGYITHGSPEDNLWEYVHPATHQDLFQYYLDKLGVSFVGLGHTHVPFLWKSQQGLVFNPGSVGQPRGGDSRASYALLTVDDGEMTITHHAVAYDVEGAAKRITDAGLPANLAQRLFLGI
jgi:putative phosphoesterase